MIRDTIDAMLASIPLPALAIDSSERILAANVDAANLIGGQIVGRNYVTMLRQPTLLDAVEATLRDGTARTSQFLSNEGTQDTTYRVSCRAVPEVGPDGTGIAVLVFEDVSHVEQAGQMRRDFVANVSHELRTPLTALMGFIETLRGPARDDSEASQRFLNIMQDEAERMNRLLGDLMSLNRVERDERVRPTTIVSLVETIASTVRTLGPLADVSRAVQNWAIMAA